LCTPSYSSPSFGFYSSSNLPQLPSATPFASSSSSLSSSSLSSASSSSLSSSTSSSLSSSASFSSSSSFSSSTSSSSASAISLLALASTAQLYNNSRNSQQKGLNTSSSTSAIRSLAPSFTADGHSIIDPPENGDRVDTTMSPDEVRATNLHDMLYGIHGTTSGPQMPSIKQEELLPKFTQSLPPTAVPIVTNRVPTSSNDYASKKCSRQLISLLSTASIKVIQDVYAMVRRECPKILQMVTFILYFPCFLYLF